MSYKIKKEYKSLKSAFRNWCRGKDIHIERMWELDNTMQDCIMYISKVDDYYIVQISRYEKESEGFISVVPISVYEKFKDYKTAHANALKSMENIINKKLEMKNNAKRQL